MDIESHQSVRRSRFKSGFVAIIGAPNVGKSTLLNQLLGEKVAIATPKPQTTRRQIKGILTGESFQVVFVDTPGIHGSRSLLNRVLVNWATQALEGVDVVLFLVDVTRRRRSRELAILDLLKEIGCGVILVLNKVDRVAKETLLPVIDEFREIYPFEAMIPVSAKYGDGTDLVIDEILRIIPEGVQYYDGAVITDQTMEDLASELIREKVFLLAKQEVPYSTAVQVESLDEDPERNLVAIRAVIFVEKPSQKGIIIGKGGRFLRKIGMLAREELEAMWGRKVFLDVWVKVLKDWSRDESSLKRLGLTG